MGDYAKAIEYHGQRLAIAKEVSNRAGEGRAYGNEKRRVWINIDRTKIMTFNTHLHPVQRQAHYTWLKGVFR